MPTPFSEVLERCISAEGRAKLRNWLTSVLLPLLDGEAEPAESLANYVLLLLEANHDSPEEGLHESKHRGGRLELLRDQLTDKLTEFLEGESRNFVGKLLRQMKSIAGVQGRGKEIPSQEYSGGRRRDSVGEWVPRGGGGGWDSNNKKQPSGYVDDHEQHKRPRHSHWGGEGRKTPSHHQKSYSGWTRGIDHHGDRGAHDLDQGSYMPTNRVSGNQAGGPEVDGRGWGQPSGFASSNTWGGGGEIGNISEGGGSGEHFVEGGMNQRQRREPAGPPQDIGSGQMRGGVAPGLGDSEEIPDRRPSGRSGLGGMGGGPRMVGPFTGQGGGGAGNWGVGMMMPPHPTRPPVGPRGGGWGPSGRMQMNPGPGRGHIGGPGNSYPGMIEPWPMGPPSGIGGRGGGGPGGQGGHREMYDPLNPEMGGGGGMRRHHFGGPFDGGGSKKMGSQPWGGMDRGGAQGRGIAGSYRHQGGGGRQRSSFPSLPPEKRSTIRVQGLPMVATPANLTSHFKTFGRVAKVELKTNADGTPSGIAFVQFTEPNAAKQARESPIPVLNNRFVKVMIQEWNLVDLEKLEAEEKIQQKAKVNATAEVIHMQKEKAKAMQVESLAQQKLANIECKLSLNWEMLEMLRAKSEPPEEEILQVDEKLHELEHARDLCKVTLSDASAKVTNAISAVDKAIANAKMLGAHVPLEKTASNSSSNALKLDKSSSSTPVKGLGRKKSRLDPTTTPIGTEGAGLLPLRRRSIDNRTTCILVKGIPHETEDGHLRAHFVVYGAIAGLRMQPFGESDSAVIKFKKRKAAELAMRKGSAYSGGLKLEMKWIDDSTAAVKTVDMANGMKDISAPPEDNDSGVKWKELENHSEETVRRGEEIGDLHSSSKDVAKNRSNEKEGSSLPQHLDLHAEKQESNHQEEDEEEVVVL